MSYKSDDPRKVLLEKIATTIKDYYDFGRKGKTFYSKNTRDVILVHIESSQFSKDRVFLNFCLRYNYKDKLNYKEISFSNTHITFRINSKDNKILQFIEVEKALSDDTYWDKIMMAIRFNFEVLHSFLDPNFMQEYEREQSVYEKKTFIAIRISQRIFREREELVKYLREG